MHIIHFKVGVIDLIDLIDVWFFFILIFKTINYITVYKATGIHMVILLISHVTVLYSWWKSKMCVSSKMVSFIAVLNKNLIFNFRIL